MYTYRLIRCNVSLNSKLMPERKVVQIHQHVPIRKPRNVGRRILCLTCTKPESVIVRNACSTGIESANYPGSVRSIEV